MAEAEYSKRGHPSCRKWENDAFRASVRLPFGPARAISSMTVRLKPYGRRSAALLSLISPRPFGRPRHSGRSISSCVQQRAEAALTRAARQRSFPRLCMQLIWVKNSAILALTFSAWRPSGKMAECGRFPFWLAAKNSMAFGINRGVPNRRQVETLGVRRREGMAINDLQDDGNCRASTSRLCHCSIH